jgi:hypothetical protein
MKLRDEKDTHHILMTAFTPASMSLEKEKERVGM